MVETDDIAQLKALILAQQKEIAVLKAVIADLTARLAQNSTNFGKPPSSDGLAKKPLSRAALIKAYQASRHGPITANEARHWRACYQQLCEQADEEELPPIAFFKANGRTVRAKRSKGRCLLDRLILHQDAVLAFAFELGVPFTNNQAERDVRAVKVKQRVSGCFRTESGAGVYAHVSGFVSTMRKQGRNVVGASADVLTGGFQWAT